jgi:FixJ family two-component response regulator
MTGIDLLRKLAPQKDRIKVIVPSGHDDLPNRELSGELGVVAFFRKPVDDQALIDTIEWAKREMKP